MKKDSKTVDSSAMAWQTDLRFWQRSFRPAAGRNTGLHAHPFWQVELIRSGPIDLIIESETAVLTAGDLVVLPPEIRHAFGYSGPENEWLTLKFYLSPSSLRSEGKVFRAQKDSVIEGLVRAFNALPLSGSHEQPITTTTRKTAEQLLVPLLQWTLFRQPEAVASHPALVGAVERRVRQAAGQELRVRQLAADLGLSANHLSTQFRQMTGQPLKTFIDEQRAEEAKRQLLYSENRISEVAAQLGFPDVYSFSRFMRRHFAESPRAMRQRLWEQRPV